MAMSGRGRSIVMGALFVGACASDAGDLPEGITIDRDEDGVPANADSVDSGDDCSPGTTSADPNLGTVACIPSGTFTIGCVAGRDDVAGGCFSEESSAHTVELTRSYWMMEAEVTQAQYAAVVGSNPSYFVGSNLPVAEVSWDDAVAFADAVSVAQGLTPCGSGDPYGCDGWRLPTEAEWEYAARAGTSFPYSGGSDVDQVAWYGDNWGNTWDGIDCGGQTCTRPVCTKARNGFGLCDLSGNVWEWTSDWYGGYSSAAATDPIGRASGSYRVVRGGYWFDDAQNVRVADRYRGVPGGRDDDFGFRLVRSSVGSQP